MMLRKGKIDEAMSLFKRALTEDAKNSAVLLNMAAVYNQQKAFDQAINMASQVLIRDPNNIGAYRIMASVYFDKGDLEMAQLLCLRGLKVRDKDPRILNTLGLVMLKLKKIPEALSNFRQALEQEPDMIQTRFNVAKVALDYKDFKVAREEFQKILEYDPNSRKADVGLGIAMRGTGDMEAAKAHFTKLAEKHKSDALPHYWLCVLALRNFNDNKGTIVECEKFIELSGSSLPSNHPAFAMIQEAKNNIDMDGKVKAATDAADREQKKLEEKMARLAKARQDAMDQEWEKAVKNEDPLPAEQKPPTADMPFVVVPLTVPPDKPSTVRLVGGLFDGKVAKINIGSLKATWRVIDDSTIEMDVLEGMGLGGWDILVTLKDKTEMMFQMGLFVAEKKRNLPKFRQETLDKEWAGAEQAGTALPPAKPSAAEVAFLVVPLAIPPPEKIVKVRLIGAEFRETASVFVGKAKVKFKLVDPNILEIEVPKGLKPGGIDVKVQIKGVKAPLVLANGLWIAEKKAAPPPEQKPKEAVEPDGKGQEGKGPAGKGTEEKASEKKEPAGAPGKDQPAPPAKEGEPKEEPGEPEPLP
jgi:tetratricopeptide (TPR) repeat protein